MYALLDPRYQEVRYIGASTEPWARVFLPYIEGRPWQSHVAQSTHGGKTHKDYWIQGLVRDGLFPQMIILEWGVWPVETLAEREIWWIDFYLSIGTRLLNKSGGGEQTPMWRMRDETRALISQRTKEAMQRPDVIARLEAGRARYRAANPPRRPLTTEQKAQRRAEGRHKNKEHSAAVWASYTHEQKLERARRISEGRRKVLYDERVWADRGIKMAIGKRLAKARRNGWTLPIVPL